MRQRKFSVFDGLLWRNAVLAEGMVLAPIVVCCNTLQKALLLSLAFACITALTVSICSFYPQKAAYAVKMVLYALTAAVIFIPTAMLCRYLYPDIYAEMGMYLPLLTVNSFIVLHSELYFYRLRRTVMLVTLLFYIAGFALTAVLIGAVRELLTYGSLGGHVVDMPLLMQGFSAPWAGFILLGVLCALHRVIFPKK
jgi:electron transport complex protein RnfE